LTASPSAGSQFGGWVTTSCDSIDGPVCNVTMNDARAITATFLLDRHQLGVTLTGSGSGYVVSNPVGVNCGPYGPRCFNYYDYGTVVTMSATPDPGSMFAGWTGCDSFSGSSCTVTMTAEK